MTDKQIIYYAVLGAFVVVLFGWHYRQRLLKQRVRRQMNERGETPVKPPMRPGQWRVMAFAVVLAGLMFWLGPRIQEQYGARGIVIAMVGLCVVLTIVLIILQTLTQDREIVKALRASRSGDVEGGIAIMQNALATQPSGARAAALGAMLSQSDRPAEAAEIYARAESLDPTALSYSVLRALAMGQAGQAEAGLAHVAAFRAKWPQDGGLALASAVLLSELGRMDEAREQLRQADEMLRAFHDQQQVDWYTSGSMRVLLRNRLGRDDGGRAFQVSVPPRA